MDVFASNQAFIVAAYVVTWLAIIGYMARLVRQASKARAAMEAAPDAGERAQ